MTRRASELARHFVLDPNVDFLNHGSFGACPKVVLDAQDEVRAALERQPVGFMLRQFEDRLARSRHALANFLSADASDVVFVPNATSGVNAVLRSLALAPGDEILVTSHGYNACNNAARFVADRAGASVVVAKLPFPIATPRDAVDAILDAVTERTRLVLVDHITSPTGLILPVADLAAAVEPRGIEVLVDGAHAPGMVPLDVPSIGATYYTGNLHKWVCAPKGAAFLWVRRDRQADIRPTVISHGANTTRTDRSRFQIEFEWTGTFDPSPWMVVADALEAIEGMSPDGWPGWMARNRALALRARDLLCDALGVAPPAPDSMIGALAAVPLPDDPHPPEPHPMYLTRLQDDLLQRHDIEVPIIPWPTHPKRLVRVSAQAYNAFAQYEHLAAALATELDRERAR